MKPSLMTEAAPKVAITQESPSNVTWLAVCMCSLAALFYCYEYYLRVAPSVMSNELKSTFLLSDAAFGHLAACYYYAYTPMQIPVGMLLDRFGPKRVLSAACLLSAFGTYLFATTHSLLIAQLGRFLVGFGAAFGYVGVLKVADLWLPKKYFALVAGMATTLGMLGAIGGVISMSALVAEMGWQATLYYSVWTGLVLAALLFLVLRDKNTEGERGESFTPRVKQVLQGLILMIKNKEMWINGCIGFLTFLPISAFAELWVIPFLETAGLSKSDAALGSSIIFMGFAIGGPCWGMVSDLCKSRRIPLMIGSITAAFFMWVLIMFPSASKLWMYSLLFLASVCTSAEILVFAVSNDQNAKEVCATAASFTNMITMIGGMLLPPLIGLILDKSVNIVDGLPVYEVGNYTSALMVLPIGLVLAAILSFYLKESYKRD